MTIIEDGLNLISMYSIAEVLPADRLLPRKAAEESIAAQLDSGAIGAIKGEVGSLLARCHLCGPAGLSFSMSFSWKDAATGKRVINWREHLTCPGCGLNNRMRATIHILDRFFQHDRSKEFYCTEQKSQLFAALRARLFPNLVGSEFLGSTCPLGADLGATRNEDLTRLTFGSNSLAGIFSFDVLEHIPNYRDALSEIFRCLLPGGIFVFSVPFNSHSPTTLIRAQLQGDGAIRHLLEPEYHGDPLDPERGILCFQTFGWDLLDLLRDVGFDEVKALDYWSLEFGYLGNCLLFVARRPFAN